MLQKADQMFVPLCKGISGKIGEVKVDSKYVGEPAKVPIDTLVLTLVKEEKEENKLLGETEVVISLI